MQKKKGHGLGSRIYNGMYRVHSDPEAIQKEDELEELKRSHGAFYFDIGLPEDLPDDDPVENAMLIEEELKNMELTQLE